MPIPHAPLQQHPLHLTTALSNTYLSTLPLHLLVGIVYHTTDTLADIESGGHMGIAQSCFLSSLHPNQKNKVALGLRGKVYAGKCLAGLALRIALEHASLFLLICNGIRFEG